MELDLTEDEIGLLRCPVTGEALRPLTEGLQERLADLTSAHYAVADVRAGLVNRSETLFYPAIQGVLLLLPIYALPIGGGPAPKELGRDKAQVFSYYNDLEYIAGGEDKALYADTGQWVDYRPVAIDYVRRSFRRAGQYLDGSGKFYLDAASGPIGLSEYIDLSKRYETRICVDLSFRALTQARANLTKQRGLFICADITRLPLADGCCDAVLSQHTLYHVPADEQEAAVLELYRVAKPGATVGIVYNWFHHAWLMNATLAPVQLYRFARYLAARVYGRLFARGKRLYFFVHGPGWFRRFPFRQHMEFYCWRTANKYFLRAFAHEWLGGRSLLAWLSRMEDRYPRFFGRYGDYPIIVIRKPRD